MASEESEVDTPSEDEGSVDTPDSEDDSDDATAWRRAEGDDDEDGAGEVDTRVAGAFDDLNSAIAKNNEVEAKFAEVQRELQNQREAGQASLATLEKKHRRHLRQIERFRAEQQAAQQAEQALRKVVDELSAALETECLAAEAIALHEDGLSKEELDGLRAPWGPEGWREADAALEERRAAASHEVRRLEAERRRCAADAEKRARRLVARSAAVGDAASAASPFLVRQASQQFREATLEASLRQRSAETAKAKAKVKQAMGTLERISLEIQQQKQPTSRMSTPPAVPLPEEEHQHHHESQHSLMLEAALSTP